MTAGNSKGGKNGQQGSGEENRRGSDRIAEK